MSGRLPQNASGRQSSTEDSSAQNSSPEHASGQPGSRHQGSLKDLDGCRVLIDELDRRLVEVLNERTAVVEEIGRIKQNLTLAIYEPKREEQVYANVLGHNRGPLPDESVKRIFERIIDEMRTVQKIKMLERGSAPAGNAGETC